MKLLFFVLYLIAGAGNVIFCALGRQIPRKILKVFLMPLLTIAYWQLTAAPDWCVLAALVLGWLGDIALLWPNNNALRLAGVGCFAVGHVFYLLALGGRFVPLSVVRICAVSMLLLVAAAFVFSRLLRVMDREMKVPGAFYFLLLTALVAFSALLALGGVSGGRLQLAGALLFFCSDTILCYQFFTVGDPAPRFDVLVMNTYILAQLALVLGFCL